MSRSSRPNKGMGLNKTDLSGRTNTNPRGPEDSDRMRFFLNTRKPPYYPGDIREEKLRACPHPIEETNQSGLCECGFSRDSRLDFYKRQLELRNCPHPLEDNPEKLCPCGYSSPVREEFRERYMNRPIKEPTDPNERVRPSFGK